MIKKIYILFLVTFSYAQAQEEITVEQEKVINVDADKFVGVNMFDELFYIKNDVLYKKTTNELYTYKNVLLGNIGKVDILNSLETTLFYKDFNTVVQLDKKLGEINKIDFNLTTSFYTVSFASLASNKSLWIFNVDTQQILIYKPQQDVIEIATQPILEEIIEFDSNYNFCWVLTKSGLLQYNVYGNLLNTYEVSDFEDFIQHKGYFILKKNNLLYLLSVEEEKPKLISLPELTIKDFSVTNETLYIYDGKELHSFKINLNKE